MSHVGLSYAQKFFTQSNASSYNKIVKLTTFGQDGHWKNKIADKITEHNNDNSKGCVLDLACGTGILSSLVQEKKRITVIGIDLTFDYLKNTKNKSLRSLCVNGQAEYLPFKDRYFDYVVSSYLPKYADLNLLVRECRRILKKGGKVILHDFIYPSRNLYRMLWKTYFRILKVSGRLVKSWKTVFEELDKLIVETNWFNVLPQILTENNFESITKETFTIETAGIISATKNE
jgi:demethylmenaquinone methyltransferase/2-methoxy-6-polyprenyl-1,4-benzoquinol methylase